MWEGNLKECRSREEREAQWKTAPRMPHGDDPRRDKIVSIQYARLSDLDFARGEQPVLNVLREWAHPQGERGILADFGAATGFWANKWNCVMAGYNVADFERAWFWKKGVAHGFVEWGTDPHEWERPCIDLFHTVLLFNADAQRPLDAMGNVPNMFYGASLDNFSRKRGKGDAVTKLYHERRFAAIDDYTRQEFDGFVELWDCLVETMPQFWRSTVAPRVGRA